MQGKMLIANDYLFLSDHFPTTFPRSNEIVTLRALCFFNWSQCTLNRYAQHDPVGAGEWHFSRISHFERLIRELAEEVLRGDDSVIRGHSCCCGESSTETTNNDKIWDVSPLCEGLGRPRRGRRQQQRHLYRSPIKSDISIRPHTTCTWYFSETSLNY